MRLKATEYDSAEAPMEGTEEKGEMLWNFIQISTRNETFL